jgi:molecular chaperone Hsp33
MLVQFLPPHGQRTMPDLPGDGNFANPDTADASFVESDAWATARALFATVGDDELADPAVSAERLLFRLFHETGVRVFDPMPLEERCTCSAERIEAMLRDNFTAEERQDMVVDGEIEVVCEFCSADYHFKPHEFEDTKH